VIAAFARLFERWHFIPKRLAKLAIGTMEQLACALRVLVNFAELAETIGWTALLWLGVAFANLLVARAFGLHFGLTEAIFVLGWSLAGSLVPTPGGAAGAFHAATAAGFIFWEWIRDCSRDFNRDAHYRFRSRCGVWVLLFPSGRSEFLKTSVLASPEAVEHVVEDEALVPDSVSSESQALGTS
jgi:hypothetical protein